MTRTNPASCWLGGLSITLSRCLLIESCVKEFRGKLEMSSSRDMSCKEIMNDIVACIDKGVSTYRGTPQWTSAIRREMLPRTTPPVPLPRWGHRRTLGHGGKGGYTGFQGKGSPFGYVKSSWGKSEERTGTGNHEGQGEKTGQDPALRSVSPLCRVGVGALTERASEERLFTRSSVHRNRMLHQQCGRGDLCGPRYWKLGRISQAGPSPDTDPIPRKAPFNSLPLRSRYRS